MYNDVNYAVEPIFINTDHMQMPVAGDDPQQNRATLYAASMDQDAPLFTIAVTGYNRLEKTKYCVQCILDHTADIDYELLLIDNGSSDGTYEFFQSVPYKNKRVVKVSKNLGVSFVNNTIIKLFRGKYLAFIPNDVYVTHSWLTNLLTCLQSDPTIGFVVPVSSNISNLQMVNLGYSTMEQMQEKAAAHNKSDPSKWAERMRLITVVTIITREFLDNVGFMDKGFIHDFSDDDLAIRIRRAGYKMILCEDTFVCHDHDLKKMEDKDPAAHRASLQSGRKLFREKYHGLDAWDDITNFEKQLLFTVASFPANRHDVKTLSIDVRCGTPVLEVRNHLRRRGTTDVTSCAFTTHAKYYLDLQTVAGDVQCDRIDYIQDYYTNEFFDIVHLGEPINAYHRPIVLLQKLYDLVKPGGILLFKLHNVNSVSALFQCLSIKVDIEVSPYIRITPDDLDQVFKLFTNGQVRTGAEQMDFSEEDQQIIAELLHRITGSPDDVAMKNLMTDNYLYCIEKSR